MLIRRFGNSFFAKEISQHQAFSTGILFSRLRKNFSSSFQANSLCNFSRRNFSTQNNSDPQKKQLNEQKPGLDFPFDKFEEFIKGKTPIPEDGYFYDNKVIFENTNKTPKFTGLKETFIARAIVWAGLSVAVMIFGTPILGILGGVIVAQNVGLHLATVQLIENNIMKIELVNSSQIKFYPLSNKEQGSVVNIKDIKFDNSEEAKLGIPIFINLTDPNDPTVEKKMLLYLHRDSTVIRNIYLFRSIINGDAEEVAKFKFSRISKKITKEGNL